MYSDTKRIEILICTVNMIPLPFIQGGLISWPPVVSPTALDFKISSKSPKIIPAKQKGTFIKIKIVRLCSYYIFSVPSSSH